MKYRRLTNGDYTFGSSKFDFVTGVEAVAQAVMTRLKLLQGEWWENLKEGLPLWQEILGNSGSTDYIRHVDTIIKQRIAKTEGVKEIVSYEGSFNTQRREYSFVAKINTEFSENTIIEGTL